MNTRDGFKNELDIKIYDDLCADDYDNDLKEQTIINNTKTEDMIEEEHVFAEGEKLSGEKLQKFLQQHFIDYAEKKFTELAIFTTIIDE